MTLPQQFAPRRAEKSPNNDNSQSININNHAEENVLDIMPNTRKTNDGKLLPGITPGANNGLPTTNKTPRPTSVAATTTPIHQPPDDASPGDHQKADGDFHMTGGQPRKQGFGPSLTDTRDQTANVPSPPQPHAKSPPESIAIHPPPKSIAVHSPSATSTSSKGSWRR